MGVIPGYIDQVNTIVRWWENPCDAPWTVYAELALKPAGNVGIALLAFGLDDVARGMFRPKGLRGGRHGRRGRKSGRRRGGIPEIGEMIGKNAPGAAMLKGREVTDGVKKLWMLDGIIQRGLWYWLVADLTLGFFAEWLGAVQESEVCRTQRVGSAAWEASPTVAAIQGWQAFQVAPLYEKGTVKITGSPAFHSSGFTTAAGQITVAVAASGAKSPGTGGEPNLQVRVRTSDQVLAQESASPDPNVPGKSGSIISPRRYNNPGTMVVEIRAVPSGFYRCDTMMAVAVQTGQDLP